MTVSNPSPSCFGGGDNKSHIRNIKGFQQLLILGFDNRQQSKSVNSRDRQRKRIYLEFYIRIFNLIRLTFYYQLVLFKTTAMSFCTNFISLPHRRMNVFRVKRKNIAQLLLACAFLSFVGNRISNSHHKWILRLITSNKGEQKGFQTYS